MLSRRWRPPVSNLTFTAWQLTAGGVLLVPLALLIEPPLPQLTGLNLLGFLWLGLVGGAFTYIIWFRGVARLERERHVVGRHPATVILDLEPQGPALGDSHRNASRTGVYGDFNQFLERCGGSFDHFTGCDPIYERFRQAAY